MLKVGMCIITIIKYNNEKDLFCLYVGSVDAVGMCK